MGRKKYRTESLLSRSLIYLGREKMYRQKTMANSNVRELFRLREGSSHQRLQRLAKALKCLVHTRHAIYWVGQPNIFVG